MSTVLSLGLLAFQISIPWTVRHFATEDGPSHLYTAMVARDLLLHRHSAYRGIYEFNGNPVPNWTSTVVIAILASVVGPDRVEKTLMGLCLGTGFFCFAYAIRTFSLERSAYTPLINFLLQSWFLWLGFYNFYLGMALCPFVVAFYVRRAHSLRNRDVAWVSAWLVLLYFTHLVAAAIAFIAISILAVWTKSPRKAGLTAAALLPVAILFGFFAKSTAKPESLAPGILDAWHRFPMQVFSTADEFSGNEIYLWPVVLGLIGIAVLSMTRSEWRTIRGGLAAATITLFVV